jgi:transforming growth factor-beta-induced protein
MKNSLACTLGVSLALAGVLVFTGGSTCFAQAVACEGKDIVDTAVAAGSFKTLAAALKAAGLVDTLKGEGPFTVFAPTDEAFAKLPAGTLDDLLKPENKGKLTAILTYHMVPGEVMAKDLTGPGKVTTVGGKVLKLDYKVMVDGANVIKADVAASNGVIHVIDAVLMPKARAAAGEGKDIVDTAIAAGNFQTLAAALKAAGLVGTLKGPGPFTVFAPTDEAFAKLPAGTLDDLLKPENKGKLTAILTYHVVPGNLVAKDVAVMKSVRTVNGQELAIAVNDSGVTVDGAKVARADIICSNGVIHVIDAVVLPMEPAKADKDIVIVDMAVAAGSFKTLAAALKAAGLVETLKGPGPFTVFAPTDEAFTKLPAGTLDDLLKPENKGKLTAILTYHVVPGEVMAKDLTGLAVAKTVNGQELEFTTTASVGTAQITKADINCSNGAIHVIDAVLMPPETAPAVAASEDAQVKEAQSLLEQVLAQIKERKLDLAETGLQNLEGMTGLPPAMLDKVKGARKSLELAKSASQIKLP